MDHVFILYAVDSNGKTTIIGVFSNYDSAFASKSKLKVMPELRQSYNLSVTDCLFIDSYVVYD